MQYPDGLFDCGSYEDGFLEGSGRVQHSDGLIFQGTFHKGRFHGKGVQISTEKDNMGEEHLEWIRG